MSLRSGNYPDSVCRTSIENKTKNTHRQTTLRRGFLTSCFLLWALLVFQGCLATLTPFSGQGWSAFDQRAWTQGGGWCLIKSFTFVALVFKRHTPYPDCHDWHLLHGFFSPLFFWWVYCITWSNIQKSAPLHQPEILRSSQNSERNTGGRTIFHFHAPSTGCPNTPHRSLVTSGTFSKTALQMKSLNAPQRPKSMQSFIKEARFNLQFY